MADLRRMTLRGLRARARAQFGVAAARLKTREALVRALSGRGVEGRSKPAVPAGKPKTPAPRKLAAAAGKKKVAGARRKIKRPAAKKARPGVKKGKGTRPKGTRPRAEVRSPRPQAPPLALGEGALDPAGFFVARVRGEGAIRDAPHPMVETRLPASRLSPLEDEQLGELPSTYGEDALFLLPRDPTSLFAYWDQAPGTLREAFREMDRPRAQLWLWARVGDGWDRVRVVELALESRGFYLHGLRPGQSYRAELRAVDGGGRERSIGPGSAEVVLPPAGPSPFVEDRFVRLPWGEPLGPPLGPGWPGTEISTEARDELARASLWPAQGGTGDGSSGSGRPSSSRPTSPGGEGER